MVVQDETSSLQKLQQTVNSANKAAQESKAEVKLLQTSLQLAQGNAANSAQTLEGSQKELSEKEQVIDAAKVRLDQLNRELGVAKADLQATKDAARKAETAAGEAKQNAMRNKRRIARRLK